jgi:3-hydroxyisobutyrate dehydrogenase-like beta-hydroxyacid dehydrogenase
MTQKIAFLGLGVMGGAMAANLVKRGYSVIGWNRTKDRPQSRHLRVLVASSPKLFKKQSMMLMWCFLVWGMCLMSLRY